MSSHPAAALPGSRLPAESPRRCQLKVDILMANRGASSQTSAMMVSLQCHASHHGPSGSSTHPGPSVARTLGVVPAGMAEPPAIIRGARSAFFGDGLPLNGPGGCPTGPSTEMISGTPLVIVPLDCSMPQGYERLAGIAADRSRW